MAISMASYVRNPYERLVTTLILLFMPSTEPDDISPLARNQFIKSASCARSIRATFFIGSVRLRSARSVQTERKARAQYTVRYRQNRETSLSASEPAPSPDSRATIRSIAAWQGRAPGCPTQ